MNVFKNNLQQLCIADLNHICSVHSRCDELSNLNGQHGWMVGDNTFINGSDNHTHTMKTKLLKYGITKLVKQIIRYANETKSIHMRRRHALNVPLAPD
jgi:hypothetical protein